MNKRTLKSEMSKTKPWAIFLLCICLSAISWWYLTEQRQNDLKQDLQKQSDVFTRYILNDIGSRIPTLERLVHRWVTQKGTPKGEFLADAGHLIEDIPGIQAIEWVDETYHVRWVEPLKGNEKAVNLFLGFEDRRLRSLEEAKSKSILTMTKPITLVQGGKGLLVYFPIRVDGDFKGFVLAVFNTQKWIDFVFKDDLISDNFENFDVQVQMAGDTIFQTGSFNDNDLTDWTKTNSTKIFDHSLSVSVQPTPHFFVNSQDYVATVVMLVFICFGSILASLVYYLKKADFVSSQMKISIRELDGESKERQRAEKEANAANEAKTKFLAAMSHEIRTPLNGVLGALQLVENTELPSAVTTKLKIARESGFFLLTLVNQVLDFARIEAGSIEKSNEDFVIGGLLADLYSMFKLQAENKQLQFDYKIIGPEDKCLNGDFSHIKQILFNLIGNALKFTQQGAVTIIVKVIDAEDDKVNLCFEVSDTGPGISIEEQSLIFEEFKQSETGRKSGMGTGLGLSISKQLAHVMEGELTVTSKPGLGTTFTLMIEVNNVHNSGVSQTIDKHQSCLSPKRILVAEDNKINQLIVEEMLEVDGHTVTIVGNGALALNEIQSNPEKYDLILMDIQMPIMNGVEATKAIRTHISDPAILPIFALTANAFESQVEHYLSIGMQGTLTKPIVQKELRASLLKYFAELGEDVGIKDAEDPSLREQEGDPEILNLDILNDLIKIMSKQRFDQMIDELEINLSAALTEIVADDVECSDIVTYAHQMSGMCSNVGLDRLAGITAAIELKAQAKEETMELRKSLTDVLHLSMTELSAHLSKMRDEKPQLVTT